MPRLATSPRSVVPLASALAFGLLLAVPSGAQKPPDFSGVWKLNHGLSDDAAAKITEAAGAKYVSGAPSIGSYTVLPWGRKFSEGERITLRDLLLAGVPALENLEIEQSPDELKTIHGEDGLRVFYLKRAGAGTSVFTGEKVTRRVSWKGEQLVLESSSGKTRTDEVLTLVPARNQLFHALRIEMDLLEHPIDLKLVYDRVPASAR